MNDETRSPEQDLLISSLDSGWTEFCKQLSLSRESCTEEAVHYLRVSLRRLLTLCDLIYAFSLDKTVKGLQKELLKLRDRFDKLRDTQVMILRIGEVVTLYPEAGFFMEYLQRREHKALIRTGAYLAGFLSEGLVEQVNQVRLTLQDISDESHQKKTDMFAYVDRVFLTVLKKRKKVDPANPASIHPLRIAFRNFRYLLEVIHPVLSGFPLQTLGELKKYQDAMGEVQNDEVLLNALQRYAARKHAINQDRVVKHFNEHHAQAVRAFFENITSVEIFWRVPEKKDFPWDGETVPSFPPVV